MTSSHCGPDRLKTRDRHIACGELPEIWSFVLVPVSLTMRPATPFSGCETEARECDYAKHVRIPAGSARPIQQRLGVERAAAAVVPRASPAPVAHRRSHGTSRRIIQSSFNPPATSPAGKSIDLYRANYHTATPSELEKRSSAVHGKTGRPPSQGALAWMPDPFATGRPVIGVFLTGCMGDWHS